MKRRFYSFFEPLKKRRKNGFTIIEVLIALTILVVIMTGMVMALTGGLRLNSSQKQRALAQDVARDVVSRYIKNEPYDQLNPFELMTQSELATAYATPPVTTLYDASAGTDNLASGTVSLSSLKEELDRLREPKLEVIMSPIRKDNSEYYESKFNAIVRVTWGGSDGSSPRQTVEVPVIVSETDLTRADRELFESPQAAPTPTPASSSSISPSATPGPSSTPQSCLPVGTQCGMMGQPLCSDCCATASGTGQLSCGVPNATPTPTATPVSTPTPTATPVPTPVPTPTPTPVPTPTPTPVPTPICDANGLSCDPGMHNCCGSCVNNMGTKTCQGG